jgi:hypothetical protein
MLNPPKCEEYAGTCTQQKAQAEAAGNGTAWNPTQPEGINGVTLLTAKVFRSVLGITSSLAEVLSTPSAVVKIAYRRSKSLGIDSKTVQTRETCMLFDA